MAPTIPGTKFYYNSDTGFLDFLPEIQGDILLHTGLGWHGPFNSKDDALAYYKRNQAANPGWKAPAGISQVIGNAPDAANQVISNAENGVLGTFKGINLETWVLRIGELVLGIVLIGVGLAKLTGTTNIIAKAAKVAAL